MTLASITRRAFAALVLVPAVVAAQDARPLGPAGTVTLSRTEYDRLLDLANRARLTRRRLPRR
jgi:hypothetical protein